MSREELNTIANNRNKLTWVELAAEEIYKKCHEHAEAGQYKYWLTYNPVIAFIPTETALKEIVSYISTLAQFDGIQIIKSSCERENYYIDGEVHKKYTQTYYTLDWS